MDSEKIKTEAGFTYSINEKPNYTLVSIGGRLIEKDAAEPLIAEVEKLISEGKNKIVVYGKRLDYMNSSGLGVLLHVLTKARNSGGEAVLCELSKKVKQLFIITKLTSVYSVLDSLEEAEEKFKN